jgi:hypothetical protein
MTFKINGYLAEILQHIALITPLPFPYSLSICNLPKTHLGAQEPILRFLNLQPQRQRCNRLECFSSLHKIF